MSTENEQLLHKFFTKAANLYPPLSDKEHQFTAKNQIWFGLVSLFNGISTFLGYLIPKIFARKTVMILFNP